MNFKLEHCLFRRISGCLLGIDSDNSPLPKAVIHYWRNRIGIGGGFGVELLVRQSKKVLSYRRTLLKAQK